jgi:putative acetyltransferase
MDLQLLDFHPGGARVQSDTVGHLDASGGPGPIRIRPFEPGDAAAFRHLNEAWIRRFFRIEEEDAAVLSDPEGQILRRGGHILVAVSGTATIGCCCLRPMEPGVFELAKMAVSEAHQGRGVGRLLLERTVALARKLGARRLHLGSNATLRNAIHLYESVGFSHVPPERLKPSPYARANVFMEMDLL